MPAQIGDVVSAYCSQCKENMDVDVVSVAGSEIVTVTCKTCGTSQRNRAPMDKGERARAIGRRVVDVGSAGEPTPRPRGRPSSRRVLSSTGREIIDDAPPRRAPATPPPPTPAPPPVARPAGLGNMSKDDLKRRWGALTANLMSRHGRPHRDSESYNAGEIVLHTAYGMGVIEQVASDGTLTALFRNGYQELPSRPRPTPATPAGT